MERGRTRGVILAGAIGNVLEWYDFAVYGYFATAIGRVFFPSENEVAQVLAAFGVTDDHRRGNHSEFAGQGSNGRAGRLASGPPPTVD